MPTTLLFPMAVYSWLVDCLATTNQPDTPLSFKSSNTRFSYNSPTAAGRVYAAYGGVYIFMAILWLWAVDGIRPTAWDLVGSAVALVGMAIIMFAPRTT
ncbi:YnfA family protein [Marinobacter salarius]